MKPPVKKIRLQSRFDFEVGYLVKSPCKGCPLRAEFPHCMDRCETLAQIQGVLAESVSLTRRL